MLVDTFELFSAYSQLEVNGLDLDDYAGPHWTDRHVEQGFIWIPASVSFGLLHDFGRHVVEVYLDTNLQTQPEAVRAIVVPFSVLPDGQIKLSNCADTHVTSLPEGEYALLFETGYIGDTIPDDLDQAEFWVRLTFVPQRDTQPTILVADDGLSPTYPLLLGVQAP
jgi:hypothetical protein